MLLRRSSMQPSRCITPSRRESALRFMPRYRAICSRVIPAQTISPVFRASCRRYASSLVRPFGMDRSRIWPCSVQYFSEISSSRLDSSLVQSLPPSSAEQRVQRKKQNFGRLCRAKLNRTADRPGRHQHISEQTARLVHRGQALLPVGRISPRLHAPGQNDPRVADPFSHGPQDAVFCKAGRAG